MNLIKQKYIFRFLFVALIVSIVSIVSRNSFVYAGSIIPSTKTVYKTGSWIQSTPTGSANAISSNPSSSPITVYHLVTKSVTVTFNGSYYYYCTPNTSSYNFTTGVTTYTIYTCSSPQPPGCNRSQTITENSQLSSDVPGGSVSYSDYLCQYNARIRFPVHHEYDQYKITVSLPTSYNYFYVKQHSPIPSSSSKYGQIGYKVTVACMPAESPSVSYYPYCRTGYQDINAVIPVNWLSFHYSSPPIRTKQSTCNSNVYLPSNPCYSYFAVTPYTYGENLSSSFTKYVTPIHIYFSNSYVRSGGPQSSSYFCHTNCAYPNPSSIEASTNVVHLVIFSSWIQSNGGNTYSSNGYNINTSSLSKSGSSAFNIGGLIEYKGVPFSFLANSGTQQPVNTLNLMAGGHPIYDFNFFVTLYCQFSTCTSSSSSHPIYSNGIINPGNIIPASPSSCSPTGANWYYMNSSSSSIPSMCSQNDILLVNGNLNISGDITGISNLLIISNGNITIGSGVTTVDAFLMAMGKINILN